MYVGESEVKGFKNKYDLPVCKNSCPYDGHTKREYVKRLVRQLNLENPGVKKRLFSAIQNGNIDDWIKCTPEQTIIFQIIYIVIFNTEKELKNER